MRILKTLSLGSSIGVMMWSIWIDVSTYNVIFKTDKNIVAYCLDGLMFNYKKILIPLAIYIVASIVERHYENRLNRCR